MFFCLGLWLWLSPFFVGTSRTYMCVAYVCAHKDLGCKGTKKFWNMQIDEEKSAKYFRFASDWASFGGFIRMKSKKEEKNTESTGV